MSKKKAQMPVEQPSGQEYLATFSDAYKAARTLEGKPISTKELMGESFVVRNYFRRRSKFEGSEEYAAVQIEHNGQPRFFNTSSQTLMDQIERTKDRMPYRAKLDTKTSSTGRKYLTLS